MALQMTKSEIARKYNNGVNKKAQIQILADLNGTTKDEIIEVLKETGCELPPSRGRKPKTEPVKKEPAKRIKPKTEPIVTQCEPIEPLEEEIEEVEEMDYPEETESKVPVEVKNLVVARIDEITADLKHLESELTRLQGEYKTLMRYLEGDVL